MKLSDEDERLLFDIDQLSVRLDLLFLNYKQVALDNYTGDNIGKIEADVDSLKKSVIKALAGVDNSNMGLVSLKAAVAQLIAQNNRTLLSALQRNIDSTESPDSD